MITKESIVKSAELHSELNDTIKTMRQAILELASRVPELDRLPSRLMLRLFVSTSKVVPELIVKALF